MTDVENERERERRPKNRETERQAETYYGPHASYVNAFSSAN